ncbi:hypothetical protein DESUT3_29600 [Desulfuromonas versatilis]|uniref:CHRD domain-containing protein n=1 Tax=Desulfuromonas versatilis TaxID=2802975 RepID=A0ABM8HYL4_9BACT|nr:CHRD domain-containing protein [Desulfuromonas versatilis]BCR05891.1 hypothetical protein DESUT3_29600 [Desulfuromonas versatilis]
MVRHFAVRLLAIGFLLVVPSLGMAELTLTGPVTPPHNYPLWYQDANGLKMELCTQDNGFCLLVGPEEGGIDPVLGVGVETFWFSAAVAFDQPGIVGGVGLDLEGAFLNEAVIDGDQMSFGRVRIRLDVDQVGTYRVIHPYGEDTFVVDALVAGNEINFTEDIGCVAGPCDFDLALTSRIGPFLFWDSELPQLDVNGEPHVGNPNLLHTVLGSPTGNNFVRIERNGVQVAIENQFALMGKVFTGDGNTAPTPLNDVASTTPGTPVLIDVLANDTFTDIPINPGSVTIATPPTGGTAVMAVENGKVMVRYTPNGGFTGPDSFSYTVRNFAGLAGVDESAPAVVSLEVEALAVNRAELRPNLLKWRIEGTSSDATDNSILLLSEPLAVNATLSGAQEVPPVTTTGSGSALVTPAADLASLDFTLSTANLLNTQAAHIHVGAPGVDGPIIFNLAIGLFGSPVSGTLTAADLQPQPAQGINTFDDALRAILSGRAYVNVHTDGNPGGEIRGQLGPARLIGEVPVQADGSWSFQGKSTALPPTGGGIRAISSNAIAVPDVPLERR